jgi:hypothetical protein
MPSVRRAPRARALTDGDTARVGIGAISVLIDRRFVKKRSIVDWTLVSRVVVERVSVAHIASSARWSAKR